MMKFCMKNVQAIILGLLLFCVSCGDADLFDFGKLSDSIDWQPDVTLSLAHGDYEIWDLINQYPEAGEDTLIYNENGELSIRYTEKNIFNFKVTDVFTLPDQKIEFKRIVDVPDIPGGMPGGEIAFPGFEENYSIQESMTLDQGAEIKHMYASIRCTYVLPEMPFEYTVQAIFENIKENGEEVKINVTSDRREINGSLNLSAAEIDMAASPNTISFVLKVTAEAGQMVNPADLKDFEIQFVLDKFDFRSVMGKIAPQEIAITPDKFNMNVDFWDDFNGSFNFANPSFDLIVSNKGLGVPVQLAMDVEAFGDNGKHVSLVAEPLDVDFTEINSPLYPEVIKLIGYDTANSNIADLLSLPPKDYISYKGTVTVNPGGGNVFITNNAEISADVKVNIPLKLSATDLIFADTIKDIDITDADKIKTARITVIAQNAIPLELETGSLLLLDERKVCIDEVVVSKLLDAPAVDANGNVIAPAESKNEITLTAKNISSLNRTKYIVILVKAQTSGSGRIPVTIKPDAKLSLQLLLGAKFDMNNL